MTCIRQWGKKMVDAGFQPLVFEDAMEVGVDGWEQVPCLNDIRPVLGQQRHLLRGTGLHKFSLSTPIHRGKRHQVHLPPS